MGVILNKTKTIFGYFSGVLGNSGYKVHAIIGLCKEIKACTVILVWGIALVHTPTGKAACTLRTAWEVAFTVHI